MPDAANTQYGIRPWMVNTPIAAPSRPNTYETYVTDQALATVDGSLSDDQIRELPGPLPIDRFPDRFGYRDTAIGIEDVARLDDIYRRVDFSGRSSGYSGTSYPSLNQF